MRLCVARCPASSASSLQSSPQFHLRDRVDRLLLLGARVVVFWTPARSRRIVLELLARDPPLPDSARTHTSAHSRTVVRRRSSKTRVSQCSLLTRD